MLNSNRNLMIRIFWFPLLLSQWSASLVSTSWWGHWMSCRCAAAQPRALSLCACYSLSPLVPASSSSSVPVLRYAPLRPPSCIKVTPKSALRPLQKLSGSLGSSAAGSSTVRMMTVKERRTLILCSWPMTGRYTASSSTACWARTRWSWSTMTRATPTDDGWRQTLSCLFTMFGHSLKKCRYCFFCVDESTRQNKSAFEFFDQAHSLNLYGTQQFVFSIPIQMYVSVYVGERGKRKSQTECI